MPTAQSGVRYSEISLSQLYHIWLWRLRNGSVTRTANSVERIALAFLSIILKVDALEFLSCILGVDASSENAPIRFSQAQSNALIAVSVAMKVSDVQHN
jgi:hypothetical protein